MLADDQPIAVVLGLVHPSWPGGRLGGKGGDTRFDEAVGANVARKHPAQIAAPPGPWSRHNAAEMPGLAMRCIATQKSFRIPLTPAKPDQISSAEVGVVQGGVMRQPKDGAFDPETVNLLRGVLDDAWERLSPEQQARTQKSDVALRILRLAMRGERDPVKLRMSAVTEVVADNSTTILADTLKAEFEKRPPAPSIWGGPIYQVRRRPGDTD
jgi:hypothetical protein